MNRILVTITTLDQHFDEIVDSVNQHGRSSDNHLGRFRGMNVAG